MQYIYVFLISMLPLVELRGAIPYSQVLNLNYTLSLVISVIGNLIPIPFVYFFAHKILVMLEDKKYIGRFCRLVLKKGHKAGQTILKKSGNGVFLALMLFVAIPLPGTGAYTAILAASILNFDFKKSFIAISLGVVIAAIIMSILTFGVKYFF